jgi:hypothetical protein
VVVEIAGITPPARFARLSDALAALWDSARLLPLDGDRELVTCWLTDPHAEERTLELLTLQGARSLTLQLPDGPHVMSVRWAEPEVTAKTADHGPG